MHWYWFGFTQLHILSISLVIMTPLSVVFAWIFFRVCERPFMRSLPVVVKYKTLGLVLPQKGTKGTETDLAVKGSN